MTLTHEQIKTTDAARWLFKIGNLPRAFVVCVFLGWKHTPTYHWTTPNGGRAGWFPNDDELIHLIIAEAQRRGLPIIMDWRPDCSTARGWWVSIGDHPPCNDSELIVALVQAVAVLLESEK